jgi:hypothetical protein
MTNENPYLKGLSTLLIGLGGAVGVIGLGAALAIGGLLNDNMRSFWFSFLLAYVFLAMISLGGLFFVLIKHLTRSTWSIVVRRIAEISAATLLVLFILGLVFMHFGGARAVFPWWAGTGTDHLLQHKEVFLNWKFFLVRYFIYFGTWLGLSFYFLNNSVKQDNSGDPWITKRMWVTSAPAMVAYALTVTFFSFDFLMSLAPHWFSTIFGVYIFAGNVTTFMATLTLISLGLQRSGRLRQAITIEHYHDMGKLMFAFTFFWSYIAFSQFMLIWYGNLPEETGWYHVRWDSESWRAWTIGLMFVKFAIPFCGLLSRWVKKKLPLLAFFAVWILAANWYDLFFLIMPQLNDKGVPPVIPLALAATFGLAGLWLVGATLLTGGKAIVPLKDPRLAESLAFDNIKV